MAFFKTMFIGLWVVGVTCLLLSAALSYYFVHNMPSDAQAQAGRTYPLNVHGWIVYLTHGEKLTMNVLTGILFGSVILALPIGLLALDSFVKRHDKQQ